MPRFASRITLEITDIRVERLQDITPKDCLKEGINTGLRELNNKKGLSIDFAKARDNAYLAVFSRLWQSIYSNDPVKGWDANPWVWVIEFKRVEGDLCTIQKK